MSRHSFKLSIYALAALVAMPILGSACSKSPAKKGASEGALSGAAAGAIAWDSGSRHPTPGPIPPAPPPPYVPPKSEDAEEAHHFDEGASDKDEVLNKLLPAIASNNSCHPGYSGCNTLTQGEIARIQNYDFAPIRESCGGDYGYKLCDVLANNSEFDGCNETIWGAEQWPERLRPYIGGFERRAILRDEEGLGLDDRFVDGRLDRGFDGGLEIGAGYDTLEDFCCEGRQEKRLLREVYSDWDSDCSTLNEGFDGWTRGPCRGLGILPVLDPILDPILVDRREVCFAENDSNELRHYRISDEEVNLLRAQGALMDAERFDAAFARSEVLRHHRRDDGGFEDIFLGDELLDDVVDEDLFFTDALFDDEDALIAEGQFKIGRCRREKRRDDRRDDDDRRDEPVRRDDCDADLPCGEIELCIDGEKFVAPNEVEARRLLCDDSKDVKLGPCPLSTCPVPEPTCPFDPGDRCHDDDDCPAAPLCSTVACVSGECVYAAKNCDDNNVCTADSCNASTGNCVNATLPGCSCTVATQATDCDDENACTNDTCVVVSGTSGTCKNALITCDDDNACTFNECDPASGCVFPAVTNDTPCTIANDPTAACDETICIDGVCEAVVPVGNCNPQVSTCVTACPIEGPEPAECVDLSSSPDNCGACGVTISAGPDFACCLGTPTDLTDDDSNCGACGVRCGEVLDCCPSTGEGPPGACVNFDTDNANCGFCGNVCVGPETCGGGGVPGVCGAL